jgi:hypothetical protein
MPWVALTKVSQTVYTATVAYDDPFVLVDREPQIEGVDYNRSANKKTYTFVPASSPNADSDVRAWVRSTAAYAAGDVDVCNMALLRVGVSAEIGTLATENTKEARIARRFYATKRDILLAMYDWNFARGHAQCLASVDTARAEWGFIYDAPVDLLELRRVWNGQRWSLPEDEQAFDLEGSLTVSGNKVVLSDYSVDDGAGGSVLPVQYTRAVTDPGAFPAYFVDAFATFLAEDFVIPLTVSQSAAESLDGRFEKDFARAVKLDGKQRQKDRQPDAASVVARFGRRSALRDPRFPWPP